MQVIPIDIGLFCLMFADKRRADRPAEGEPPAKRQRCNTGHLGATQQQQQQQSSNLLQQYHQVCALNLLFCDL